MTKVIVCGSRFYTDREMLYSVLDAELARVGPTLHVIVGGAAGADELAREWAVDRRCDHEVKYARWTTEGKIAGFLRNRRMLKRKPKKVIAFFQKDAENRGTKNMVGISREAGVKVKKVL